MTEQVPILGNIIKIIACTPNKNFDENDYQKNVIEPTRQIRKLYEELENKTPDVEQIIWAYKTLQSILLAKKLEDQEYNQRISELIKEYNLSELIK